MTSTTAVYVIDENGQLGAALQVLLDGYKIAVHTYSSVQQFFSSEASEHSKNSCLLFALDACCEDGLDIVTEIHRVSPRLPIIVLCDTPSESLRTKYISAGAIDMVSKSMVDAYAFTRLCDSFPDANCLPNTPPSTMQLSDGTIVTLRMISPDDIEIQRRFVIALSERSRHMRFFSGLKKLPEHMLKQLVSIQFPISYALIATISVASEEQQIGVARYAPTEIKHVAEFAVVVADEWHGFGIASQLLRGILTAATLAGIQQLEGLMLQKNKPMMMLAKKLGFTISSEKQEDYSLVKVVKTLR